MRNRLATVACACVVLGVGAGAASAGEITGPAGPNGGTGHTLFVNDLTHELHGNSICAFSGLNNPNEPDAGAGRTQSYGQIVAAGGKADAPSPGVACNGHTGFLAGGGGE
jgi:hypothetical protein